jgi:hypothetical protein
MNPYDRTSIVRIFGRNTLQVWQALARLPQFLA